MELYGQKQQSQTRRQVTARTCDNPLRTSLILAIALSISLFGTSVGFAQVCGPTTVVVAHTGVQSTSCQNILDAIDSIDNACPSSTRRYVVKLEPGKYGCGDKKIVMKQFVDLEGSGKNSTEIAGKGEWDVVNSRWVLLEGANDSEVRNFTIKMKPPATDDAVAVLNDEVSSKLSNMFIQVKFGKDCWGVLNQSVNGIETMPSMAETGVNVVKCDRTVGVENRGSVRATFRRDYIMGANASVSNIGILYDLSNMPGPFDVELWDVRASAYGNHVADDSDCYAVAFADGSLPNPTTGFATFYQSAFKAEKCDGGNTGLKLGNFRTELHNSRVWARIAGQDAENIGIKMMAGSLKVHSSVVVGGTRALDATGGAVAYFAGSKVANGPLQLTLGAKATCINSYDNDFIALDSSCN